MQPSSHKGVYILLTLILIGVLGVLILNIIRFLPTSSGLMSTAGTGSVADNGTYAMFDTFNGTINGTITKADNGMVTIKNNKGVTKDFSVSSNLMVIPSISNGALATPSADLKKVELNKPMIISVGLVNGQLQVMSIAPVVAGGGAGAITPPPPPVGTPVKETNPAPAASGAGAAAPANRSIPPVPTPLPAQPEGQ